MTAWEYRSLQLAVKPFPHPGHTGEHPIGERLSKLGRQGWELVSIALSDDPLVSIFLFKRQVSAPPAEASLMTDGARSRYSSTPIS